MNVGKSNGMTYSRYVNVVRMDVEVNGETVRGSGLFLLPGVASLQGLRM